MRAILVPPNEVPTVWIEVKPLIDKALAHSPEGADANDMLRPIINGRCFLWIVVDGHDIESVCFGEFTQYPSKKGFHIHGWATKSGHDFDLVMETFNDSVAKIRKGLVKKLKTLNWNDTHSYATLTLR